ncbi:MAG: rhodanese-like domain-containing protein [Verrucomicrobiota bacterium]|nr:rhodanese-like domain-containing protein [Verrucomicrobiota bacterium]
MKSLSVQESTQRKKEIDSIPLIDVRTPAEFGSVHAEGAVNHPMESLNVDRLPFGKEDEIQVICQSGGRSIKVCQKLEAAGYSNVVNVEGGTSAWQASGLPVVEGKKMMSLERQVRIAAGSLIVIGAAIGQFVHPGGFGLSAFVGAGLVFAGVTDTCGMGMMIARMPWNRS